MRDKTHLQYAKELQKKYPEETQGFTTKEIMQIWEDYSHNFMAMSWMEDTQRDIQRAFGLYAASVLGRYVCPHCGHVVEEKYPDLELSDWVKNWIKKKQKPSEAACDKCGKKSELMVCVDEMILCNECGRKWLAEQESTLSNKL